MNTIQIGCSVTGGSLPDLVLFKATGAAEHLLVFKEVHPDGKHMVFLYLNRVRSQVDATPVVEVKLSILEYENLAPCTGNYFSNVTLL